MNNVFNGINKGIVYLSSYKGLQDLGFGFEITIMRLSQRLYYQFVDLKIIYLKITIGVVALKLPSILCPIKNKPMAVDHKIIPFTGFVCKPFRLPEINPIPRMYIKAPIQCNILLTGLLNFNHVFRIDLIFIVYKYVAAKSQSTVVRFDYRDIPNGSLTMVIQRIRTRCYDFTASINRSSAFKSRGSWKARKNWSTPASVYSLILCAMVSGLPTRPCVSI